MKIFKSGLLFIATLVAFLSCQKELKFDDNGISAGVFKKDAGGSCLPAAVTGIFKVDSTLTNAQYVDVQVNVTTPGTFDIRTDTINGYSFSKVGSVVFGLNTIRLYPNGKPIAAGKNTFTVKYGSSTCSFTITAVDANTPTAVFSLGGSPGACSNAVVGGTYTVGTALTPSNTLTIEVNVTTIGTYTIAAASTAGDFFFSGTGTFTTVGLQNVTLTGTGTPATAGNAAIIVTNLSSTCTFSVPVTGGTPAVYTLDGSPNACTSFVVNGTYAATVATTAANTVILNVTVASIGTYTISTNTAAGITFSKTGVFTATGAQPVTLTATGTPSTAGPATFSPTTGSGTCTFTVTVQSAPPPAAYTLMGAPGACAPITVNGTYNVASALGTGNTAVVQVNVTTPGVYTLSTNTVNGMTFSKSGVFTATGVQDVTLQGSGSPIAAETDVLTPQIGTSSCTFNVVVAAAPTGILTCSINGVPYNFSSLADATYFVPGDLLMSGYSTTTSEDFSLDIDKSSTGGTVTAGPYVNTLAGSIAGGYILGASYTDLSAGHWGPAGIFATPDPFTITITSITASNVTGTFSGTIRDNFGSGTNTKTVTNGVFNLPIH